MFCANCYSEIPKGKNCYRLQASNNCFCSLDCLNDWLIYSGSVTIETSDGETEETQANEE